MKNYILFTFLLLSITALSQEEMIGSGSNNKKQWFISAAYGVQMSGIKDEDFISKNIAPSVLLNAGLWFTPEIALQIGYKGPYFNTIADDDKHSYHFFFGEVLLNINELASGANESKKKWNFIIHSGAGLFHNNYYDRPNVCANIGIINSVKIIEKLDVFMDVSAIMGWDIYQGDEDIIPSFMIGLTYNLN